MNKVRSSLPPLFLAVLTFVVHLYYSGFPRTVWGDEPSYLWLGRNWLRGAGYTFGFTGHWEYHHSPGYPLITGLLSLITGDMKRASDWSYILFSILLVLVVYALTRRIYGEPSALAAGGILALAPATALMPLYWGTMTEPPYLGLAFAGVWLAHRSYHHFRARDMVLAGLFLALAYYVRPEAIVYLGAMGLVLGLRALARPPRLRRLAYPALLGAVFLIAIFPYLYKVRQVTGAWTVSQKVGAHFATATGLASGGSFRQFDLDTWGLDSSGQQVRFFSTETADVSALAYILSNPVGYARTVYGNALELLSTLINPRLLPIFALPFLGLALFRRRWKRRRAWDELFLMATLLPGLSFVLFFVQERYLVTLIPTLFIWFGHGVIELGVWLQETVDSLSRTPAKRARLVWAPLILLLLFFAVYTPRQRASATNPGSTRPAHLLAAQALASEIKPGDIVMSRYNAIAFHAHAEWIPTPAADVDAVLAYARAKGARYWAIDEIEARVLRPQFAPLLDDPTHPPPGLEYVTTVDDGTGPVVIFRITP